MLLQSSAAVERRQQKLSGPSPHFLQDRFKFHQNIEDYFADWK